MKENFINYGLDKNQLAGGEYARIAIPDIPAYTVGIVEDIIINSYHEDYLKTNTDTTLAGYNVGFAKIRRVPEDRDKPTDKLDWIAPLEANIQEYPLKNEMVMVYFVGNDWYYSRRVNITNKLTESSWPGQAQTLYDYENNSQGLRSGYAALASRGVTTYNPMDVIGDAASFSLGDFFKDIPTVRRVEANEGDIIHYGRFGNIIRFGSSLFSNPATSKPSPNLLITVGQRTAPESRSTTENTIYSLIHEDINDDLNSIWIVTDEEIPFDAATQQSTKQSKSHLRSSEITRTDPYYTGPQIFINSDRVVLNSKNKEIQLFSKSEINLSAINSITVDSERSVFLSANQNILLTAASDVFIKGKTVSIGANGDISLDTTGGNYSISAKKIFINSRGDPSQPLVLGGTLSLWLQQLITILLSPGLVITTTGPATLNPVQIGLLRTLQAQLGGVTPQSATFNSTTIFGG